MDNNVIPKDPYIRNNGLWLTPLDSFDFYAGLVYQTYILSSQTDRLGVKVLYGQFDVSFYISKWVSLRLIFLIKGSFDSRRT